jgi:hypothetical protein
MNSQTDTTARETLDEAIDDLAREAFSELCEGDGQHSEALDLALLRKHLHAAIDLAAALRAAPAPLPDEYEADGVWYCGYCDQAVRQSNGAAPAPTSRDEMVNSYMAEMIASGEALSVVDWARERLANTRRIATEKTGDDIAGWLVDQAYWRAIVEALERAEHVTRIGCPECGVMIKQVSSATLSLALWQHFNWAHRR